MCVEYTHSNLLQFSAGGSVLLLEFRLSGRVPFVSEREFAFEIEAYLVGTA